MANPFNPATPAAPVNPFDQAATAPDVDPNQEFIPVDPKVATPAEKLAGAPEAPNQPSAAEPKGPRQAKSAREKAQLAADRAEASAVKAEQLVSKLQTALNEATQRAMGARARADHMKTHPDLQS